MNKYTKRIMLVLPLVIGAVGLAACGTSANGQTAGGASGTLQPNETMGFAGGKSVVFNYTQNYDCVDQNTDDLDGNGVLAQSDPAEFQTPICQAGTQTTIDPTGGPAEDTAILYVLVPMFSTTSDTNPDDAIACAPASGPQYFRPGTLCGPALGKTLIKLFGVIPEAFEEKPAVYTDCPNPGSPPGTCTMHASTVDLGKVLVALGKLPSPATNVFLPTPNHSHVISSSKAVTTPIWWEVEPVLVEDAADWPTESGSSGITSVTALKAAEAAKQAIAVPSNFYLFFGSQMAVMGMSAS